MSADPMRIQPLNPEQMAALSTTLPHWQVVDGKLHRELVFADFVAAFGFISQVALLAEAMGHHPEWRNVWNRVSIDLITHDIGTLSSLDFELAQLIDRVVAQYLEVAITSTSGH